MNRRIIARSGGRCLARCISSACRAARGRDRSGAVRETGGGGPLILQKQGSFFVGGQSKSPVPNRRHHDRPDVRAVQVPEGVGTHCRVVMRHGAA